VAPDDAPGRRHAGAASALAQPAGDRL